MLYHLAEVKMFAIGRGRVAGIRCGAPQERSGLTAMYRVRGSQAVVGPEESTFRNA